MTLVPAVPPPFLGAPATPFGLGEGFGVGVGDGELLLVGLGGLAMMVGDA
jgi:hypothetical protein